MMWEPYPEARSCSRNENFQRVDHDDEWMLKFGCKFTRFLDSIVLLRDDETLFDPNYN